MKQAIIQLKERIEKTIQHVQTEEATKNAFIMPFLQALGYDVFNPTEVVPEFTADIGTKTGEKVDYAIMIGGMPMILIECKQCANELNVQNESQLLRYFNATWSFLTCSSSCSSWKRSISARTWPFWT